jgi:hypothetical protein
MLLRYPLLRYPDLQTRAFTVPSSHHRATPRIGQICLTSGEVPWKRAGSVAAASVVLLLTRQRLR